MYREEEDAGFDDEFKTCPITGRKEKKSMISTLNKKGKLSKFEMDEIFLDDS